MRIAVGVLLVFLTAAPILAEEADEARRWLAHADQEFAAGNAGCAISAYRLFLERFPNHERADHAIYMVGEASRLALDQLGCILPAKLFTEFGPGGPQYDALEAFLTREYGFYAEVFEGDPMWVYDMRAYRYLLKQFPNSDYADDARFMLIRYPTNPTWELGSGPDLERAVKSRIEAYDSILRDFPNTNRKDDIDQAVAELRRRLGG